MSAWQRDAALLWDVITAAQTALRFAANRRLADVESDEILRAALQWQVLVIGEASRRIPPDLREEYPAIPWHHLVKQRNFYAHEYDAIEPSELWHFVTRDLPGILEQLEGLLPPLPDDED